MSTREELVSLPSFHGTNANIHSPSSASPLNGEAALLWDSNQEDFKRKVLARHVEPSELEDN